MAVVFTLLMWCQKIGSGNACAFGPSCRSKQDNIFYVFHFFIYYLSEHGQLFIHILQTTHNLHITNNNSSNQLIQYYIKKSIRYQPFIYLVPFIWKLNKHWVDFDC